MVLENTDITIFSSKYYKYKLHMNWLCYFDMLYNFTSHCIHTGILNIKFMNFFVEKEINLTKFDLT